jgi:hypothetical protein
VIWGLVEEIGIGALDGPDGSCLLMSRQSRWRARMLDAVERKHANAASIESIGLKKWS